jgi:hypothetical protein
MSLLPAFMNFHHYKAFHYVPTHIDMYSRVVHASYDAYPLKLIISCVTDRDAGTYLEYQYILTAR